MQLQTELFMDMQLRVICGYTITGYPWTSCYRLFVEVEYSPVLGRMQTDIAHI